MCVRSVVARRGVDRCSNTASSRLGLRPTGTRSIRSATVTLLLSIPRLISSLGATRVCSLVLESLREATNTAMLHR